MGTLVFLALLPGTTWYWQLQGTINHGVPAQVYDIDMENTSKAEISALKSAGRTVICYFSAGSYENWRPDAGQFPAKALGRNLDGWPGERWLDTRNTTVREIMRRRMERAKAKGCDGVEPDNVDGYSNNPGFPLTASTQVNFNRYLATTAHSLGLVIGLKNSTDLVPQLVNYFDFAVVEQCYQYNECSSYNPFIAQNKAVLIAEYSKKSAARCRDAKAKKYSLAYFSLALDGKKFDPCN